MNGVVAMRRVAGVGLLLLAVGVPPVAAHHGWSGSLMLWTGVIACGRLLAYF